MKTLKIKFTAITRLSNTGFLTKAQDIAVQLGEHADVFAAPPVAVIDLQAAIDTLANLTVQANGDDGSHTVRNDRDNQQAIVLNMLYQIAGYVLSIASAKPTFGEQKSIVELAGFEVANTTHNPVVLNPVEGLKVATTGVPGDSVVKLNWKRGKARAFIIQTTQGNISEPDTVWSDAAFVTRSKHELSLSPGTWAVRVIAVASTQQSSPSQAVQIVVG